MLNTIAAAIVAALMTSVAAMRAREYAAVRAAGRRQAEAAVAIIYCRQICGDGGSR
jgi:hypothetical protein